MKIVNIVLICAIMCFAGFVNAQAPKHSANFELGSGLTFDLNDGAYSFKIGGMIQPYLGVLNDSVEGDDIYLSSKRTYFNISGQSRDEKLEFFIQTDFSLGSPLLDAWVQFKPVKSLALTFGQKQTIGNNREMLFMEDQLQFPDRSMLSTSFSSSGREFGVFAEYKISLGNFVVVPQAALTSGDGRNSFGADSRDVDLGGMKYAGRLDIYPLGEFSENNEKRLADLSRESTPKILLGFAASLNDGASNNVGEGHGDFFLYNRLGDNQLPDYRKLFSDIMVKYKGFSFLGEYGVATATNLDGSFINESATVQMAPTEISQFLSLGTAFNAHLSYVTQSGFGIDGRYSQTTPEFEINSMSIIGDNTSWGVGLTKFLKQNDLKFSLSYTALSMGESQTQNLAEVMLQLRL